LSAKNIQTIWWQWYVYHAAGFLRWAAKHNTLTLLYQVGRCKPHQVANPQSGAAAKYKEVFALLQMAGQLLVKALVMNQKGQLLWQQHNRVCEQYRHA
jgi:hypothetical protein